MTAVHYTYRKSRTIFRRVLGVLAFVFGFFAPYFTASPKLWNTGDANHAPSPDIFVDNHVQADYIQPDGDESE